MYGDKYRVCVYCDDGLIAELYSKHTLAKTLRLAVKQVRGGASLWAGIRRWSPVGGYTNGVVAEVETNWRGEISEVSINSPVSSLVTPINPGFYADDVPLVASPDDAKAIREAPDGGIERID